MATFVLLHGMWHGGWCWQKITPLLRAAGHSVFTPTFTGLGERAHLHLPDIDLPLHVQDVVGVLEYESLEDVILVGHSYGGTLLLSIADRVAERLAHLVNLDGPIPRHGQTFQDILPDLWEAFRQAAIANGDEWWAPPPTDWTFGITGADWEWTQSKLTAHPLKTWQTPMTVTNSGAYGIPRTYIDCIEGLTPEERVLREQECQQLGWRHRTLVTGHDAMITAPRALAELLLEVV
jgi:pimeloyl-ACP methyl ester carboxylesterase